MFFRIALTSANYVGGRGVDFDVAPNSDTDPECWNRRPLRTETPEEL
jgi:hypothetical protein